MLGTILYKHLGKHQTKGNRNFCLSLFQTFCSCLSGSLTVSLLTTYVHKKGFNSQITITGMGLEVGRTSVYMGSHYSLTAFVNPNNVFLFAVLKPFIIKSYNRRNT